MSSQTVIYASLVTASLVFSSAASANVLIAIDKSTQHMTVSVNGATRYDFPVSTGRPGFDTPDGIFHPHSMFLMHHSSKYENAPMPHSIFFTGGDAIHGYTGTPFGVAAVSHGCVRLPLGDAAALYQVVGQQGMSNTTIVIRGSIPRRPMVARAYGVRRGYGSYGQRSVLYARQQDSYGRPETYNQQPFGYQRFGYQPTYGSPQPYGSQQTYGGGY
jgi:hypothetical protein